MYFPSLWYVCACVYVCVCYVCTRMHVHMCVCVCGVFVCDVCAHVCVCIQTVAHASLPCVLKERQFHMIPELLPTYFFMILFLGQIFLSR